MTADSVFNAYLDANIILIFAAGLWAITRFILNRTALRHAFPMQLQLIYGVLLAVACAPLVIALFHAAQQAGLIGQHYTPSVSDYALAQYLNGRFEMAPLQFESLWMSRTVFIQNVTTLGSPLGIAVALMIGGGVSLYTAILLRNIFRVRKLTNDSYPWRRFGNIDIRLTDRADIPFSTRNLRRRFIVLPSALLSEADDLRIAISHELQHMRQGDLGWEIALEFLRPLFFWNPAFAYFKREAEELRELACDHQVLSRQRFGVKDYCDCLLRVCRNGLGRGGMNQILVPSVPLVASAGSKRTAKVLKHRVVSMLAEGRLSPGRWVTMLLALPLLAVISFGSIASQSSGDWSQDRLMLSTIVNLERLDQRTLATRY